MTVRPAMDAKAICTLLRERLHDAPLCGTVLSAFEHAVNIETPAGLVSILTEARCLHPFAVRTDAQGSLRAHFAPGERVLLHAEAIRTERTAVSLEAAAAVDLSVVHGMQPVIAGLSREHHSAPDPAPLLSVLASGGESDGLSALVTRLKSNVYADFLGPRLPRLFAAVQAGEAAEAGEAAAAIAGCGIGLTPSSDDLLTGYMAMLHAMSAVGVLGNIAPVAREIAGRAAKKTNRISGAFLLQSGEGYVSEDVLRLLRLLYSDSDAYTIKQAAMRVAAFGSTSGSDMLTGIVLAIIHHDGGKNSGQTGNQEKCLF